VLNLLNRFDNRDKECIKEVIVVVDQPQTDCDSTKIEGAEVGYPVKVIYTGTRAGASFARNIGSRCASGEILLYLDSDVEPEPGLVYEHYSSYLNNGDMNIIGVAGITRFQADGKSLLSESVLHCSLLYPFFQAKTGKPLFWAPTSNLSFKRCVVGEDAFDQRFPKFGGGEDIFMCLKTRAANGRIWGNPSAIAKHEVWDGAWNVTKRFFRWGIADSILLKICSQQRVGIVRTRLPTTGTFLLLLVPFAIAKAALSASPLWLITPLLFFLISLSGTVVWKYLRRKKVGSASFWALTGATVFLYIFDLGCVLGRLDNPFSNLFKEIQLFPEDLDIYRVARLRVLLLNIFVFTLLVMAMIAKA